MFPDVTFKKELDELLEKKLLDRSQSLHQSGRVVVALLVMASLVNQEDFLPNLHKEADAGEQVSSPQTGMFQLIFTGCCTQTGFLSAVLICGAFLLLGSPRILTPPRLLDAALLLACLVAVGSWQVENAAELLASVQRYNIVFAFLAILLPRCKALLVATLLSTLATSFGAFHLPQGLDALHAKKLLVHLVIARVGIIALLAWSRCQLLRESATIFALGTMLDSTSKGFCAVDRRSGVLLSSSATLRARLDDWGLAGRGIEEWTMTEADAEAVRAMLRGDKDLRPVVIARPCSQPEVNAGSVKLVPCLLFGHEILVSVEFPDQEYSAERSFADPGTQTEEESSARRRPRPPESSARSLAHSMRSRFECSSCSGRSDCGTIGTSDAGLDSSQAMSGRRSQTVTSTEAAVAAFKTTQPQVCANSLLWLMSHWNTPKKCLKTYCCPYHAQLVIVARLISVLKTRPCNPLWSPFLKWQCDTCSCLNSHEGFECSVCGSVSSHANSAASASSTRCPFSDMESLAEMSDDGIWADHDIYQSLDDPGNTVQPHDEPAELDDETLSKGAPASM